MTSRVTTLFSEKNTKYPIVIKYAQTVRKLTTSKDGKISIENATDASSMTVTTTTTTTVQRPFVRDNPGRPVPEETFTSSHPS